MNKQNLVSKVIEVLERDLAEVEANIQNLHATANEAEGRMQSRYESQKSEVQMMASDMEITKAALHGAILFLKNMPSDQPVVRIASGSLIETNQAGATQWYLMVPFGGGKTIEQDGTMVKTITPDSKIGTVLMNRKQGDSVVVTLPAGEKTISIITVS